MIDVESQKEYYCFMHRINERKEGVDLMEAGEELRKLRESTGMNRKEFCEYFEIPYMTETDWELGNRRVPHYLLRLIAYKIQMEKLS